MITLKLSTLKKWSLMAALCLLTACAARPPTITHYVLAEPESEVADAAFAGKYAIGSIRMAEFLKGNALIIAETDSQIRHTRMHRWAERLEAQIERQLRLGLAQQFPQSQFVPLLSTGYLRNMDYRVDLHVDAFHLNAERQAVVRLQWFVRDAQEDFVHSGRIATEANIQWPAEEDSDLEYAAMVEALSNAWHDALTQLGQQLQQVKQSNHAN
ncbi:MULTISPECIES: membrane integrity-associated transporter subunit PqiC [Gammaproteobacteria]|uniref:PqiC family protein n=1 Tax=Gammaproteobacteria TaxID=1236 RepID=UPI000DD0E063|nr:MULTISPECIES: ABC-type transport auxiliary lipoprotein family protein [Gammaproteobacteria]RTE86540.1 hypothetical protein DQX04_08265 [Aliidiomarina sp. B3213]TCZ90905.1 hypothetical protein EYQ95_08780 [Lysobacter sp. N42]